MRPLIIAPLGLVLLMLGACDGSTKAGSGGAAGGIAQGGAGGMGGTASGGAASAGRMGGGGGGGAAAGGAPAGGGRSGGAGGGAGTSGGGGKSGGGGSAGAGGGASCELQECKRPFECRRTCDGPIEYSGCCACEPPLFDDFGGMTCGMSTFCAGSAPRMIVNGTNATPAVTGQMLILDCCDGGRFLVTATDFAQPIAVQWWAITGSSVQPPTTVDLAGLPSGWTLALSAGCSVTSAGCSGGLDSFTSGFTGSLSLTRVVSPRGLDMTLCLHFEEPAGKPGLYVHTLDLYAPHISTSP